jgi:hypothetical protein
MEAQLGLGPVTPQANGSFRGEDGHILCFLYGTPFIALVSDSNNTVQGRLS